LCSAKQSLDLVTAGDSLNEAERQLAMKQLAVCEGSDWFWWFGDYNPQHSVESFDKLYRENLSNLYHLLKLQVPRNSAGRSATAGAAARTRAARCAGLRRQLKNQEPENMTKPIALLLACMPTNRWATSPKCCMTPISAVTSVSPDLIPFPGIPFAVHFSGWLLDWLFEHYPEDMALLREMVQRGQAELFGAGDTEPVLAVIPYRDRIGQIETLSAKLGKNLGSVPMAPGSPSGCGKRRVPALADAGIRYVTVDDYHFLCAGKSSEELDGYFTTEEDGRRLDLFPISEALRYVSRSPPPPMRLPTWKPWRTRATKRRSISTTSKNSASGGDLRVGLRKKMAGTIHTRRAGVKQD